MPEIHVLDKHVAELIAAGEVVERPASVIKELVENSIDAGATAVTVEIQHGGITFMRVTDNGCGIPRDQVPKAFLRHATSKVQNQDDLTRIHTLGFRGEALASIAAVTHVEMLTRTQEELAGTHYVISGGEEEACEDAGCAAGTTLVLRDLFYNTPARMKFLKKDVTEGNAVAGVMDHAALSHPEVAFRLLRDGREVLNTPGDGKLKNAVFAVFGREFTSGLLPVDYTLDDVHVWGFISKPVASRPNRSMQNFFLNGRYVKSRTAMVAMEQAFRGSLMVGKFPACVLHIQVNPATVDVNVHPSKMEIRFMNEKPVFEAVYHGVKTALQVGDAPSKLKLNTPQPVFHEPPGEQTRLPETPPKPAEPVWRQATQPAGQAPRKPLRVCDSLALHTPVAPTRPVAPVPVRPDLEIPRKTITAPAPEDVQSALPESESDAPAAYAAREKEQTPARFVGEAFSTYILIEENGDELRIIDKHAAHERMLYEQLCREAGDIPQQMLLSPVTVTLSKEEYSAVLDNLETLAQAGFAVEDFGAGSVLVRSAPIILGEDVASAVEEMAGYLAEHRTHVQTEKLDWLFHNVACRAAVKAGDESSPMELAALAARLEQEDIRYCPHGRPVSIVLKRKDLERQFGRA